MENRRDICLMLDFPTNTKHKKGGRNLRGKHASAIFSVVSNKKRQNEICILNSYKPFDLYDGAASPFKFENGCCLQMLHYVNLV
jgi:hypothetical protein